MGGDFFCIFRNAMNLFENDLLDIQRAHRFLWAQFKRPHTVLGTCPVHGGIQHHLSHLLNYQSTEGSATHPRAQTLHLTPPADAHLEACNQSGLPMATTATMGTAAQMEYASLAEERFEDCSVLAVTTAGVQSNAGRAGDPADWHEKVGTINIMLFFNASLSPAALVRAAVTLTEAKTAALLDLSVPSRYSARLATGTGTDQFQIAAPTAAVSRYTWTGKHAKIGELIGKAVHRSVQESLRWQNGLEPALTRSLTHQLGRFGVSPVALQAIFAEHAPMELQPFLCESLPMIEHDPRVACCAMAIASLLDHRDAGALTHASALEGIQSQCALMACDIGNVPHRFAEFQQTLRSHHDHWIATLGHAFALGFAAKWTF